MTLCLPRVRVGLVLSSPPSKTRALLRALRMLRALFREAASSPPSTSIRPRAPICDRGSESGRRGSPACALQSSRLLCLPPPTSLLPASTASSPLRRSRSSVTALRFNLKRGEATERRSPRPLPTAALAPLLAPFTPESWSAPGLGEESSPPRASKALAGSACRTGTASALAPSPTAAPPNPPPPALPPPPPPPPTPSPPLLPAPPRCGGGWRREGRTCKTRGETKRKLAGTSCSVCSSDRGVSIDRGVSRASTAAAPPPPAPAPPAPASSPAPAPPPPKAPPAPRPILAPACHRPCACASAGSAASFSGSAAVCNPFVVSYKEHV